MDPSRKRHSANFVLQDRAQSEGRLRAAPREPASSGQFPLRFTRMREILLRYLSPIMVDSVLGKALRARNATPASLGGEELSEIAAEIMVGLRLFVDANALPRLMLELAEFLEWDFK